AQQVAVDGDLRVAETDMEDFVGNQKVILVGIALRPSFVTQKHTSCFVVFDGAHTESEQKFSLPFCPLAVILRSVDLRVPVCAPSRRTVAAVTAVFLLLSGCDICSQLYTGFSSPSC